MTNVKRRDQRDEFSGPVQWFHDTKQVTNIRSSRGNFEPWFHGLITRTKSEEMLVNKCEGSFLIRVSQTRFGYSLSFKGTSRCYHIAIEQKGNQYVAVGDDRATFGSLRELVKFYKQNPIVSDGYKLTEPVGQEDEQTDYMDLISADIIQLRKRSSNGKLRNSMHTNTCSHPALPKKWEAPEVKTITRDDVIKWCRDTQLKVMMKNSGEFYMWFHGILTRSQAEALLFPKPKGAFIVRVCDDRCGSSVSIRSDNKVKHFDVEQMKNGNYNVIGELKEFKNMNNLVQYYKMYPISSFGDKLKDVVGQDGPERDYDELLPHNGLLNPGFSNTL